MQKYLCKKFIELPLGTIAYLQEGNGPVVILLHGFPTSCLLWREVIPILSPNFTVYALDLMGFGDSKVGINQDCSITAQCEMVISFMQKKSISKAIIVGHDLGGGVAQLIGLYYPQKAIKLVMASSIAYSNFPIAEVRFLMGLIYSPIILKILAHIGFFRIWGKSRWGIRKGVYNKSMVTDEIIEEYLFRPFLSSSENLLFFRKIVFTQMQNGRVTRKIASKLSQIYHPTLIIWGKEDAFIPCLWGKKLAQNIPGTQKLILLPQAGHFFLEEKASEFSQILVEWFHQQIV